MGFEMVISNRAEYVAKGLLMEPHLKAALHSLPCPDLPFDFLKRMFC